VIRNGRRIEVVTLNPDPAPKRRRREGTFVQVPLQWASKALIALNSPKAMVLLYLLYKAWREKSNTVTLPNSALADYGVGRKIKYRALREMEVEGLIAVRRAPRKAPVVTLIW
jgi:hypothetical protein